jgi:hypothetical protein
VTPIRDKKTTKKRGGPQEGRPNAQVPARTNVTAMVTDASVIAMNVGVLQAAADLIADRRDLERRPYERGVLHGFGLSWEQAMEAGAERSAA